MKPTKEELEILESGTFQEKMNLIIDHYMCEDDEWITKVNKIVKRTSK